MPATAASATDACVGGITVTTNVSAPTSRPTSSQFTAVGTAFLATALDAATLGAATF
jgi:hypothetical protein